MGTGVHNQRWLFHPIATPSGILFTNNYASAIYLSRGSTIEELLSAPGCGSYYVQSFEGNEVGLKLIDEKGYQSPVLLDLRTGKIKVLSPPSPRAGQVSFTRDGRVAYTLGEQIVVSDGMTNRRYDIGVYANLAPISPDGRFVAYNDGDDQIWLLDLTADRKRQISDSRSGYFNPAWSPNGA